MCVYIYTLVRQKLRLLSFPQWTWLVCSSAHPFPGRILAWSFAVPRSHFHPPKALKPYIEKRVIIDRPTPATQNGLENVIRGWPKWVFCKAFKKHKLCSSWRVQKVYLVGIAKSFADFCTCFSLVITPHNMSVSILFVCTATRVPWRTVQKAYLVGIAKLFADFWTCFS